MRLSLALLWLAALLVAGWLLGAALELGGDLRSFMPSAETPAQKLLLDELGEGPGSRLLLLALSGDDAETLATQSRALREHLAGDARFALVANGDDQPRCVPGAPAPVSLPAVADAGRAAVRCASTSHSCANNSTRACRTSVRRRPAWSNR